MLVFDSHVEMAKARLAAARWHAREAQQRAARRLERVAHINRYSEALHTAAAARAARASAADVCGAHRHDIAVKDGPAEGERLRALALSAADNNELAGVNGHRPSGREAQPGSLSRAITFIESNAAEAISDIAGEVCLTPRAVQKLFRRWLNCTPTGYLRKVRLQNAHRDLLAADQRTSTVAEIAARWRFYHAGRFAQSYKTHFGCSPFATLSATQPLTFTPTAISSTTHPPASSVSIL